jgi:hypothetical protein
MALIAGVDVAAAAMAVATLHFHERYLRDDNSSFRSHNFLTHGHRSGCHDGCRGGIRGRTHVHQRGKPLGQRG